MLWVWLPSGSRRVGEKQHLPAARNIPGVVSLLVATGTHFCIFGSPTCEDRRIAFRRHYATPSLVPGPSLTCCQPRPCMAAPALPLHAQLADVTPSPTHGANLAPPTCPCCCPCAGRHVPVARSVCDGSGVEGKGPPWTTYRLGERMGELHAGDSTYALDQVERERGEEGRYINQGGDTHISLSLLRSLALVLMSESSRYGEQLCRGLPRPAVPSTLLYPALFA